MQKAQLQSAQCISQDYGFVAPAESASLVVPSETQERPIEPSPHVKAKVDAINEKKLEYVKTKSINRVILQPTSTNCEQKIIKVLPTETSEFHSRSPRKTRQKRCLHLTREQVDKFLQNDDHDRTILSKKVFMLLSYVYSLNPNQIRELKIEDLCKKENSLCVKVRNKDLIFLEAEHEKIVNQYYDILYEDTNCQKGYLMRTVHGYKFMEKRMGINSMFSMGVEVAKYLQLTDPELYGISPPTPPKPTPIIKQTQPIQQEVINTVPMFTETTTEYITFHYQPEVGISSMEIDQQPVTYQIPVQTIHGDAAPAFVQLQVVEQVASPTVQVLHQAPTTTQVLPPLPQEPFPESTSIAQVLSAPSVKPKSVKEDVIQSSIGKKASKVIESVKSQKSESKAQKSFVIDLPEHKSKKDSMQLKFEKCWKDFQQYLVIDSKPLPCDYLRYLNHLKSLGKGGFVLWTTFHRLRQVHQDKFKENIRDDPELLAMIKTFKVHQDPNVWEPRDFTMEELNRFVFNETLNDKFWLLRKTISLIAFYTKFSYKSLKNMKMQDVQIENSTTVYVQKVLIANPDFASIISKYYETVINDSKQAMGPLFRHYHQKSDIYTKTPIGFKPILDIKSELQNLLE